MGTKYKLLIASVLWLLCVAWLVYVWFISGLIVALVPGIIAFGSALQGRLEFGCWNWLWDD